MGLAVDTKDAYVAEFEAFEKDLDRDEPEWLRRVRREAISRFQELGFPAPKHEEWKYTNLAPFLKIPFRPVLDGTDGVLAERLEPFHFGVLKTSLLTFVNGRFVPRISYLRSMHRDVRVANLAEVLDSEPRAMETHLGKLSRSDGNPFTALNTAFHRDGAFVEIPRGVVVEEPIHLLFVSTARDPPVVSHPRTVILLGENSQATILETYAGWDSDVYFTNAVTEVSVGPGAVLEHYKMLREASSGFHIATMEVHPGRGSNVACHSLSFGGALARNHVNTLFLEEGGNLRLNGLFMTAGAQQADNYTRIDHAAPACTSLELYKGILDGKSRGVFHGNILVRKGAQKTAARQTNKNLLLSKEAWVDSIPGLEILADDVKCNHASTIGQLDENAVFYLRTRGIEEDAARNMLTYAFAADVIQQMKVAPIRIKVDQLVVSRLPRGPKVGEAP